MQSSTIFHEAWWLEAATGSNYREVVLETGGNLQGRLPYFERRPLLGCRVLGMPPYTHYLGPVVTMTPAMAGASRHARMVTVISQLIDRLPRAEHVWFRLHGGIDNTLAFDRAGFINQAHYTSEIEPAGEKELWSNLHSKTRNMIRFAKDNCLVNEARDPWVFADFYAACVTSAGKKNHYKRCRMAELVKTVFEHNAGQVLVAHLPDGEPQAAVFTLWDQHRAYYYMSCRTPDSVRGAIELLIWLALTGAAARGLTYDMDGIHVVGGNIPNLGLLTRFGGRIVPRYHVSRTKGFLRLAGAARSLFC